MFQVAKILDSKRSQNVGILAQSLHVDFTEIENGKQRYIFCYGYYEMVNMFLLCQNLIIILNNLSDKVIQNSTLFILLPYMQGLLKQGFSLTFRDISPLTTSKGSHKMFELIK